MNFYFAARFEQADELIPLVAWLHQRDHKVVSSWLFLKPGTTWRTPREAAQYAQTDLRDIDAADVLVLFNEGKQSPGRNIEFGYALAKGKALVVVGPRLGVFQWLPQVDCFENAELFKERIEEFDMGFPG